MVKDRICDIRYIVKMCVKIEKKKVAFWFVKIALFIIIIIIIFTIVDANARPKTECKINEMDVILHIRN